MVRILKEYLLHAQCSLYLTFMKYSLKEQLCWRKSKNLVKYIFKNDFVGPSKQLDRATKLVARTSKHFAVLLIMLKIPR